MNRDYEGQDFPLAIGEIYGYRCWRVDKFGRLTSIVIHEAPAWHRGINEAQCFRSAFMPFRRWYTDCGPYGFVPKFRWNLEKEPKPHKEPPPAPGNCSCGFYAFHTPPEQRFLSFPVTGIIRGTGPTLIGTKGFRTNRAEIVGFLLPDLDALDYRLSANAIMSIARDWKLPVFSSAMHAEEAIPQLRTYQGLDPLTTE